MDVGMDMDDVITRSPAFFRLLAKAIRNAGGKVHIVTSRNGDQASREATIKELTRWGIEFDALHCIPGPLDAKRLCPHKGLTGFEVWNWGKIAYAIEHKLEIFFEDSPEVVALLKRFAPQIAVFHVS